MNKKLFNIILTVIILAFLITARLIYPETKLNTLIIRSFSILAFIFLTITITIGPIVRLYPKFAHFIKNRRNLGVTTFFLVIVHVVLVVLRAPNPPFGILSRGFTIFGLIALIILTALAATSFDSAVKFLTVKWWKRLHRLVYLAYILLIFHVYLGVLRFRPLKASIGFFAIVAWALFWQIKARKKKKIMVQQQAPSHPQPSPDSI